MSVRWLRDNVNGAAMERIRDKNLAIELAGNQKRRRFVTLGGRWRQIEKERNMPPYCPIRLLLCVRCHGYQCGG